MMNLCIGATVISQDGIDIGKIESIIFDPRLSEVTHLVVHKGVLLPHDVLVPMSMVQGNRNRGLLLHIDSGDVDDLPRYTEAVFRTGPAGSEEVAETPEGEHFGVKESPERAEQLKRAIHLEPRSVQISGKTEVDALDGKLGSVSCLQVDQYTNRLTFVVLPGRRARKRISVPVEWVSNVGSERISLSVPMLHAIEGPPPPAGPYIPVEPREEEIHY